MIATRYVVGLDLGQQADYTALGVVRCLDEHTVYDERERQAAAERAIVAGSRYSTLGKRPQLSTTHYHVVHLERFRLGTLYPSIIARVTEMMRQPALTDGMLRPTLVVDATGVGRPVVDSFKVAGLRPVPVVITAGERARKERGVWRCPKRDLVGTLQVALQTGRLKIANVLPHAATLVRELLQFRVRIDPVTAHDSYGAWREGDHDDLVLALAVAVWYAERQPNYEPSAYREVHG